MKGLIGNVSLHFTVLGICFSFLAFLVLLVFRFGGCQKKQNQFFASPCPGGSEVCWSAAENQPRNKRQL